MTIEEREIKTQFLLDETIKLRRLVISDFLDELNDYENPEDEEYDEEYEDDEDS